MGAFEMSEILQVIGKLVCELRVANDRIASLEESGTFEDVGSHRRLAIMSEDHGVPLYETASTQTGHPAGCNPWHDTYKRVTT